jgi:hypothetical protein
MEFCQSLENVRLRVLTGLAENQEVLGQKRPSSGEIERLVGEFETSGLRRNEFCRNHGLALIMLQRQLKKPRLGEGEAKEGSQMVVRRHFALSLKDFLARRRTAVASFNYRVGRFGFFADPC